MLLATTILGLLIIVVAVADWIIHLSMTKSYTPWGWASYSRFQIEAASRCWETIVGFKGSLFESTTDSYIHAGMVKFDGRYIAFPFLDFMKVEYWRLRHWKVYKNGPTVDWGIKA